MAPTVVFFEASFTLTGPQRAELASYVTNAFPDVVPAKVTRVDIRRKGASQFPTVEVREEGTITAAQFLALKQAGQRVSIVPGSVSGGNIDVVRRSSGDGRVPPSGDDLDGPPGSYVALRALIQSVFGATAQQAQNVHQAAFKRELGQSNVVAQLFYRRTVTAQQWVDGIAAGECFSDLYPHEIPE